MNGVVAPLAQWWDGRTVRERRLLGVMLLIVAGLLLWLAVVRPAVDWRAATARDLARAEADRATVRADLQRLAAGQTAGAARVDARGLEPVVRQSAEAAGLEITTGMDASGRLGFRISRGSSSALFGWLAGLKTAHGLEVASLGVVENADATLQMEGAF